MLLVVSEIDKKRLPPPGDWIGSLASGTLAALSGHPLAALLGQLLVPAFQTVWELDTRGHERRLLRGARTVQVATEELGCGLDELHSTVAGSDPRSELFIRVVEASARTVSAAEKVDALGRVLAMGLSDDARFDEAVLIADALRDLEAPHIKLLAEIHAHPQSAMAVPDSNTGLAGWSEKQLEQRFAELAPVIAAVVRTLSQHTLIRDVARGTWEGAEGDSRWVITAMGEELLGLLTRSDYGSAF